MPALRVRTRQKRNHIQRDRIAYRQDVITHTVHDESGALDLAHREFRIETAGPQWRPPGM
jgi:hypothetical protein